MTINILGFSVSIGLVSFSGEPSFEWDIKKDVGNFVVSVMGHYTPSVDNPFQIALEVDKKDDSHA